MVASLVELGSAHDDECDCCTQTERDQQAVEAAASQLYAATRTPPSLDRVKHVRYLRNAVAPLSGAAVRIDASRSWLCYWSTHGLALLGETHAIDDEAAVLKLLEEAQNTTTGGFSGGARWHEPHLASTYAAVATLVSIGGADALRVPQRQSLLSFLMSLKVSTAQGGGFKLMRDGEADVRGIYCALAVAYMLNMPLRDLAEGVEDHIARCQTYEGGIGGAPGCEAHGGYTFCGIAALAICRRAADVDAREKGGGDATAPSSSSSSSLGKRVDLLSALEWATSLQGGVEGGFAGRTNKLVDGCYSYWLGATISIIKQLLSEEDEEGGGAGGNNARNSPPPPLGRALDHNGTCDDGMNGSEDEQQINAYSGMHAGRSDTTAIPGVQEALHTFSRGGSSVPKSTPSALYDATALQAWILICCQGENGGLRDKPGKPVDHYHTCYCLSGMSVAQHCGYEGDGPNVLGPKENELVQTDPVINVTVDKLHAAREFFSGLA